LDQRCQHKNLKCEKQIKEYNWQVLCS
jgi:hypothetical protein